MATPSGPRRLEDRLVTIAGDVYLTCPYGGWDCAHTNTTTIGVESAQDAMTRHVEVRHRSWR